MERNESTHETYHTEWQVARINFVEKLYSANFFNKKRVLELGGFNGHIANHFSMWGANVHCVEGREENIAYINENFPHLTTSLHNLDTQEWPHGTWDVIINFGVYYHLEKYHTPHLINCINNSKLLLLETVIFDSDDAELYFRTEHGNDQSLSDVGGYPSTKYVEDIFDKTNAVYTKYTNKELNAGHHHYDWEDKNTRELDIYARRFWTVETNGNK